MRAIVQRVSHAHLTIDGRLGGSIQTGLVILVGVKRGDGSADAFWLADRVLGLRIFNDADGRMNLSLADAPGAEKGLLVVSNFTLYGDARKSRRPSFTASAGFDEGKARYEEFVEELRKGGFPVVTGDFGADMQILLCNDGPVTLILDSPDREDPPGPK